MNRAEQLAAAELFLKELGRGLLDDERVMVGYAAEATVQTDASGKKLNFGWWPVPWKEGKYINDNGNAYACISSSIKTPNPKTGEMRYWRGEASFGRGLALMVDDIGTGKGSKGDIQLEEISAILPPTVVVETSPHNFQCWYFLSEAETSIRRFKAFLSCFVAEVLKKGGDNTIKDVSRYGRMPCGINNKRLADGTLKYAGGSADRPYAVRLTSADYSRRYTIDEIAAAFKFEIQVPAERVPVDFDEAEYKSEARQLQLAAKILSLAKQGEGSNGEVVMNMSGKYRIRCPWGDEHSNSDPYGAYFRGPVPGAEVDFVFGCAHDTHRRGDNKKTWHHFVDEIVMPYVDVECEKANREWIENEIKQRRK